MKRTDIKALYGAPEALAGQHISVSGWVRTNRASRAFGFLQINDGTCFDGLQVVYDEKQVENFAEISKLTAACAVTAEGILVLTPEGRQPFELQADSVRIEAMAEKDYPLQKKRHSVEFLREIAHLRPRSNLFSAVFRIRSLAAFSVHRFFQERGFVYVNTPILTSSDAEGAGEMFQVLGIDPRELLTENGLDYQRDFFGRKASLAVSGQLEAEAFAMAFDRVYTFGPTFRAENSNTARHAAEFWMVEPEFAFADLQDNMQLAEDLIRYVIRDVLDSASSEYAFLDERVAPGMTERLRTVSEGPFARITYTEAVQTLQNSGRRFEYPVEWGIDLQTEHERFLTDEVFGGPVFVTDYPKDIKAFYMRLNDDNRTVAAADLLVPGIGELVGGSQREEREDLLLERMRQCGMKAEDYGWYLDLRRYGGVKHSGFGIGFERLIMYLTGVSNIRDVLPFPRTPGSLEF